VSRQPGRGDWFFLAVVICVLVLVFHVLFGAVVWRALTGGTP
jgi:hypothetical protein